MADIHYIVVNYYNDIEVAQFIRDELLSQELQGLIIYVVNNGSSENKINEINFKNVKIYSPGKNLGYLPSINYIYENIASLDDDIFILSNSDMKIGDNRFLAEFISEMKALRADIFAPSVISARYKDNQNPFYRRRISVYKIKFLIFVFKHYWIYLIYQLLSNIKRYLLKSDKSFNENNEVYAVHGSFVAFNKKFMDVLYNYRDKIPFLFTEELFIAELARSNNMRILYDLNLKIYHEEHTVTGNFKSRDNCNRLYISLSNLYNLFFK